MTRHATALGRDRNAFTGNDFTGAPDSLGPWIPHDVGVRLFHALVAYDDPDR